jgi:hypothetical protein
VPSDEELEEELVYLDKVLDQLTDEGVEKLTAIWESGSSPTAGFFLRYSREAGSDPRAEFFKRYGLKAR